MRKVVFILSATIQCVALFAQNIDSLPTSDSSHIKSSLLKEVKVTAKKPPVQLLRDKTIVNVDASVTNAGATILEVLEKSPGITLDRSGNISLKGKQGVTIMIDGKPAQVSGTDLTNLLSGLMAAQVDQIEIIDNPSSKYDASGNAGIINIKTKKSWQKGFNGSLSIAVGQGRYTRTVNSIILNRNKGKFNLFASLSYSYNQNFANLYALRKYYQQDNKTITALLEQPTFFKGRGPSQTIKAGADYFLDKNTTLGISVKGMSFTRRTTGNNNAIWMNALGVKDSTIITRSDNRDALNNGSLNINARHAFSETQELTADFDFLGYKLKSNQYFINHFDAVDGYQEYLTGNIPSSINIFTGKADYTQSFGNAIKLESGWKSSIVKTDNRAEYFYDSGNGSLPDLGKTNHFLYSENINALYANGEKHWNKLTLQGGLRYESTNYNAEQLGNAARKDSSFSRKYDGLFPTATISFQIDSNNNLSLSGGRRIDRPPFQSLNPFVFIINKYTYQSGNPFYRPQYTWNTGITHTFKDILVTSLTYSITKDYFSQIFLSDSTGIIYYSEGNLDKMENIGLSVSAQASPVSWWSFSGQVAVNHKKINGFIWDERKASLTQMNFNANNQFNFKKGWSGELSGFYSLREQELQEITDPNGQLSLGISKQVFKNRGVLKFLVRDVFYTQAMKGNTTFRLASEYFKITRDSRSASISFNLRFGKAAHSGTRRSGGAEDEIKRVTTD